MSLVRLECLEKNCKRTRQIPKDICMPEGTKVVKSFCPDHIPSGAKDPPEYYFDAAGRELY